MRNYTSPVLRSVVLNSWKEIAGYVGRGVRTVQRWEHDLGLPVHRPMGKDRSAVLAFPAELEQWLMNTPVRATEGVNGYAAPSAPLSGSAVTRASDLRKPSGFLVNTIRKNGQTQQARTE